MLITNTTKHKISEGKAVYGLLNAVPFTGFWTVFIGRYLAEANREIPVVLMIEGAEGLRNFEEIANAPGVDWLLEGAVDLSQSLGVAGEPFHSSVQDGITGLAETCRKADRHFCALPRNVEQLAHWRAQVFLLDEAVICTSGVHVQPIS